MTISLFHLAEKAGLALQERNLSCAAAESCTGGGLSYWITSVPGSSEWFERSFVTYSNQAKIDMLGVNPETLANFGAVSEQTAREMAEGVLRKTPADISIAITGIAGPAGGSMKKPVGTVWIAIASRHSSTHVQGTLFPGDRAAIREGAIRVALQKLLDIVSMAVSK